MLLAPSQRWEKWATPPGDSLFWSAITWGFQHGLALFSSAVPDESAARAPRNSRATSRFAYRLAWSGYPRADYLRLQPLRHEVESAALPRFHPRATADESAAMSRAPCKCESRESARDKKVFNYGRQLLNQRVPRFQQLIAIDEPAARPS